MEKTVSIFRRIAVIAIVLHAVPASAGNHVCWIDHVAADPQGVRVFFSPSAEGHWGNISPPGSGNSERRYTIKGGLVKMGSNTEASLLLMAGESGTANGGVEDTCQFSYSESGGSRGVSVHAIFHPPGLRGASIDDFIPVS